MCASYLLEFPQTHPKAAPLPLSCPTLSFIIPRNKLLKSDSFFFFAFSPSRQRTDETAIAAETSLPTQLLATTGKMKDKKTRVETFYGVASKRNTKGVFVSCYSS